MKADKALEKLDADFEKIKQDEPTLKCSNAADERGMETSQIVKSLIVKKDGELYHLCLPGDREVSEGKFGSYRLVDKEKSRELTGQKSGTVHPFSTDIPHVVDERVFENEVVSFTAGTEIEAVKIETSELRDAFNSSGFDVKIHDIVVSGQEDIEELEDLGADAEQASFLSENGYRILFRKLVENFEPDAAVDAIREFERNQVEPEHDALKQVLEESENQTHMQKIVESYAETGEIDSGGEFDLEKAVDKIIENNQDAVEDYRSGTDSALNYLLGQVMQETGGKADGNEARKKLIERL